MPLEHRQLRAPPNAAVSPLSSWWYIAAVLLARGQKDAGLTVLRREAQVRSGDSTVYDPASLAEAGRTAEARDRLAELIARGGASGGCAGGIASGYAYLGDHARALDWLQRAYEVRHMSLVGVRKVLGFRAAPAGAAATKPSWRRWGCRRERDDEGGRRPSLLRSPHAPISRQAKAALERYLRTQPRVGDLWISRNHVDRPTDTTLAPHLFVRAEARAELPHVDRGGFHAHRRLFASERKQLPDVELMRGGGWRDLATMKRSYQQPDPPTVAPGNRE